MNHEESIARVQQWVKGEQIRYSTKKWDQDNLELHRKNVSENGNYNFMFSYLQRATGGGEDHLKTAHGRQHLGKLITTALHTLETAVEMFGDMPEPGHPSGEIHEWPDPVPSERR